MTRQLALDLPHRPAMNAEDFLVAPGNEEAVAWIDRWPNWPGPALVIHGPPGCGKTHLMRVWQARTAAPSWQAGDIPACTDPAVLLGEQAACAVDDADAGCDERTLLHLHNVLAERRGTLLLTASCPPAQWRVRLPDLRSRLLAAAAVRVAAPDDALMAALIVKLFADRQIRVRQEVVDFLVVRLERSFEAVRTAVDAIDAAALAAGRGITVPFVRDLDILDGAAEAPDETPDPGAG